LLGDSRVDDRSDVVVRLIERPHSALYDAVAVRCEMAKFYFRTPTKSFLSGAVFHFQREAKLMKARVHRFVKDRRSDLCVREVRVDRECQLDEARALFMKIRSSTGESLDDNHPEVAPKMSEMVGDVPLDQAEAALQTRPHVARVNVRAGVVDDDTDAENLTRIL
jgi:hypothetical protein